MCSPSPSLLSQAPPRSTPVGREDERPPTGCMLLLYNLSISPSCLPLHQGLLLPRLSLLPPLFRVWWILHFCVCLVTSPSSISSSFYSDPSHFISPVHQDWSFEAWYLYPLHDLPVQSLIICSRHPHCILDIFSPVVMVDRVGQQDGLLLILKGKVVQMFSTSTASIPARLPMKAATSRGP